MRKSVLLVDPLFHSKGGGAAVTFWALEGLRRAYDVTLLSWGKVDFERGNRLFGTSLRPEQFDLRTPGRLTRWCGDLAFRLDRDPWSIQRWAFLLRTARRLAPSYDVTFTTNGEASFGVPGIQYVHYPYIGEAAGMTPSHQPAGKRRPWEIISGFDLASMRENRTLVNSDWTGEVFRSCYGGVTHTVYPPVPGPFRERPWLEREDGFVCVGRLNGDKRHGLIIDAVAAVRQRYPQVKLHIIGTPMPEEIDGHLYYEWLRRLVAENADWVRLHEDLSREALLDLLSRQRYGIHAKADEHFGIGVAEMVGAGCITFAHKSGGQVEIVADDRLLYDDAADAARRALFVMEHPAEQQALRAHLRRQAGLFSSQRFVADLCRHVEAFGAR